MLCRLLHIVLLVALGSVFGVDWTTDTAVSSVSCSYLSDQGAEERTVLSNHTHLNLPTSFETLTVRVSTSLRSGSKQSSRHHVSWNTLDSNTHNRFSSTYGRHLSLRAAMGAEPRRVLSRLCRLRI